MTVRTGGLRSIAEEENERDISPVPIRNSLKGAG
jgi:hypothetical protein